MRTSVNLSPRLALLHARRAFAWTALALVFVGIASFALDWAPPRAWAQPSETVVVAGAEGAHTLATAEEVIGTAGLARSGVWTLFLWFVAPVFLLRCVVAVARWDARDEQWIAARPQGRGARVGAVFLGTLACALATTCIGAALAETRASRETRAAVSLEPCGTLPAPAGRALTHDAGLAWRASERERSFDAGVRARIELASTPGSGVGALVRLRATRGELVHEALARLEPSGAVEVLVPSGSGALTFELSLPEPDSRAFVTSSTVSLWRPRDAGVSTAVRLATRVALLLVCLTAVALAASTWMSAASAFGAALAALVAASWLRESARADWFPGFDLLDALELAALGRIPPPLALEAWIATCAVVVASFALCCAGPRLGRKRGVGST